MDSNQFYNKIREEFKDDSREVSSYTLSTGQTVVVVGKLDSKRFVKKALAELS